MYEFASTRSRLRALVLEVRVDLELAGPAAPPAPELGLESLGRQVRHVADHASELEPAQRLGAAVVIAAAKRGITLHELPPDQVPRDALDRHRRRRGHADHATDALGVARRPHQDLHAAERAARDRVKPRDAEVVGDQALRLDHVLDRDPRIARAVRLVGQRVDRRRSRRAPRRARKVHAHDEVALEIDPLAVADEAIPPARLRVVSGVLAGRVGTWGQRVADEWVLRSAFGPNVS